MIEKQSIVFLGYEITTDGNVGLPEKTRRNIRRKIVKILYNHLLLYPKRSQVNHKRIAEAAQDPDLRTCLRQVRHYLYGRGVTEGDLFLVLAGKKAPRLTRGLLFAYPLLSTSESSALRGLDGWLVDMLVRMYKERRRLLSGLGICLPSLTRADLVWAQTFAISSCLIRAPSLFRAWLYVQRWHRRHPPSSHGNTYEGA